MRRADVSALRTAMEMARTMMDVGLLFVPIPVLDAADCDALKADMLKRMELIEQQAIKDEQP